MHLLLLVRYCPNKHARARKRQGGVSNTVIYSDDGFFHLSRPEDVLQDGQSIARMSGCPVAIGEPLRIGSAESGDWLPDSDAWCLKVNRAAADMTREYRLSQLNTGALREECDWEAMGH